MENFLKKDRLNASALAGIALLAVVGCSDRPNREKFPGGHGRTTDVTQAEMTRSMLGGFDPLNNPISGSQGRESGEATTQQAATETSGGSGTAREGATIQGVVTLGPKTKAKPDQLLYIAARRKGQPGPPLAVKRINGASFPYTFELGAADAMMQGTSFEGDLEITARLDQDGDPMSRQPGDAFGTVDAHVGQKGLTIKIDQVVE